MISLKKGDVLRFIYQKNKSEFIQVKKVDTEQEGRVPKILISTLPENASITIPHTISEKVVAVTNFDAENMENFLSFHKGEMLTILHKFNGDTWLANNKNMKGYVPSILVAPISYMQDKSNIYTAVKDSDALYPSKSL